MRINQWELWCRVGWGVNELEGVCFSLFVAQNGIPWLNINGERPHGGVTEAGCELSEKRDVRFSGRSFGVGCE